MKPLLLIIPFLVLATSCVQFRPSDRYIGKTVAEVLSENGILIEDRNIPMTDRYRISDNPRGVINEMSFIDQRTKQIITLHVASSPHGKWDFDAVFNSPVRSVSIHEPSVHLSVVDEHELPLPDAKISGPRECLIGYTDLYGTIRIKSADIPADWISVSKEDYEIGSTIISPLQPSAVVILVSRNENEWRESFDALRCPDRHGEHNAFIFFEYHGCKDVVPVLIDWLEKLRPTEAQTRVICTAVHCLEALQMQTGKDFWWDAQAWRKWWETEGKGLPESYFNARRRCEERERLWKQQHAAHAKQPLPESSEQKTADAAKSQP